MSLNLKYLIAKLNDTSRKSLENAAGLCSSRTNYNVEIEHWLLKMLESPDTDVPRLLKHFEIDQPKLERSLVGAIEKFKTGNSRVPALSPKIMDLVREAWLVASVEYSATSVRTGHLLLAMLANPDLAMQTLASASSLSRISAEALQRDLRDICSGTAEDAAAKAAASSPAEGQLPDGSGGGAPTAALDQFTIDLTARAREGKIDPVHGIANRFIEDAKIVMRFQCRRETAHHIDGLLFARLFDLDDLKSASQCGVFLKIFFVFGPRRGCDRPQLTAGQRRLEQVGRIPLPC